jgi:hypothetical protein
VKGEGKVGISKYFVYMYENGIMKLLKLCKKGRGDTKV